jgi:hypothetical protein
MGRVVALGGGEWGEHPTQKKHMARDGKSNFFLLRLKKKYNHDDDICS